MRKPWLVISIRLLTGLAVGAVIGFIIYVAPDSPLVPWSLRHTLSSWGAAFEAIGFVGSVVGGFVATVYAFISLLQGKSGKTRTSSFLKQLVYLLALLAGLASLVGMGISAFPGLLSPAAVGRVRFDSILAATVSLGLMAGKFVLISIIVPILKSIPALIFGIFARDWWDKNKPDWWRKKEPKEKQ